MEKFKKIISSHKTIPVKLVMITYVVWLIYDLAIGESFSWFENAVLMMALLIIYIIFSLIASSLSFNKNKETVYFLNDQINESAIRIIDYYESMDGRDKPEEVQIRKKTIAELLDSIGTVSSQETSKRIYNQRGEQ